HESGRCRMTKRLMLLRALLALGAASANAQMPNAQMPAEHPVLTACKGDIKRFCSNVPVGDGRVKACMKAHLPELSEECKEALFQAWLRDCLFKENLHDSSSSNARRRKPVVGRVHDAAAAAGAAPVQRPAGRPATGAVRDELPQRKRDRAVVRLHPAGH